MVIRCLNFAVLCFSGLFSVALSLPSFQKCYLNDDVCVTRSAQNALKQIADGIPELSIETADPLYMDIVQGDIANLKYDFNKVTITGFKSCEVKNVKLNLQKNKLSLELYCAFDMRGDYVMKGRLLILPVEGNGDFNIKAKQILCAVDTDLKQQEKDGKTYLSIKKFSFDVTALDKVHFDFKNLFNGNKQLAEGVLNFANESYEEVTKELSPPLFNASLKKIIKNINKYLKNVPLEELVLN